MWKELKIKGINKEYLINEYGEVFDIKENKLRKAYPNSKGYLKVSFYIYGKYKRLFVHRMVMQTFKPVENMENLQVNHIDCNKLNNHIDNLEWCTLQENMAHAWQNGLCKNSIGTGDNAHHKKLTEEKVRALKYDYYKNKMKIVDIIKKYEISRATFYQIKNEITWKDI